MTGLSGLPSIDEQLDAVTSDPVMEELRKWRDEQRMPLSAEELERVCEAANRGAMFAMRSAIKATVKAQLRIILLDELLILVIGIAMGYIAAKL